MMLRRAVALAQADDEHLGDAALKRPRKSVCGLTREMVTTASASRAFLSHQTGSPQLLVPIGTAVMSVLTGTPRACSLMPYSASNRVGRRRWRRRGCPSPPRRTAWPPEVAQAVERGLDHDVARLAIPRLPTATATRIPRRRPPGHDAYPAT